MDKPRYAMSFITLVMLMVVLPGGVGVAGQPSEAIQQTHGAVLRLLHDPELNDPSRRWERQQQLLGLIEERFSCREMARHILGKQWYILEPEDREEFLRLFQYLLLKNYTQYLDQDLDQRLEYLDERIHQRKAVVQAQLISSRRRLLIDFWLFELAGEWHIYDVLIDGMSLIDNYRSQVMRLLRASSYASLVTKMQDMACPHGCVEEPSDETGSR